MPFFGQFLIPKPHFGESLGVILAPLEVHFGAVGSLGVPKGTLRCQKLIFNGFWVPVGSPLGVTLGSFW